MQQDGSDKGTISPQFPDMNGSPPTILALAYQDFWWISDAQNYAIMLPGATKFVVICNGGKKLVQPLML